MCEHCKKKRHTIDQCFKLVGYPEWWTAMKGKGTSRMAGNVQNNGEGILGRGPQKNEESSTLNKSVDPVLASALYNEILKMMQNNSKVSSSEDNPMYTAVNFAGINSTSNVDCVVKKFDRNS